MAHPPPPNWQNIASFYAGRPVTIGVDQRGPYQAGTGAAESGNIFLGSGHQKNLQAFVQAWMKAKTDQQRMGLAAQGANILPVLLHEAMHNRNFSGTGLPSAWNEQQAVALGSELIPDMLQRFFGVKIGSPVSDAFAKAAKARGEYQGAYAINRLNGTPPILFTGRSA